MAIREHTESISVRKTNNIGNNQTSVLKANLSFAKLVSGEEI